MKATQAEIFSMASEKIAELNAQITALYNKVRECEKEIIYLQTLTFDNDYFAKKENDNDILYYEREIFNYERQIKYLESKVADLRLWKTK